MIGLAEQATGACQVAHQRGIDHTDAHAVGVEIGDEGILITAGASQWCAAGVRGYVAFLRGKRVIYWGRQGDQHTEWFPGCESQN